MKFRSKNNGCICNLCNLFKGLSRGTVVLIQLRGASGQIRFTFQTLDKCSGCVEGTTSDGSTILIDCTQIISIIINPPPLPCRVLAYITNIGDGTVSVIDIVDNSLVATITVGELPIDVVLTPDGRRAYVTSFDSNTVSVINTTTNRVIRNIAVSSPSGLAITPDGSTAYITNSLDGTLTEVDVQTNTIQGVFPVGLSAPLYIAISPDGQTAYVTDQAQGTLSIVNLADKTFDVIFVGSSTPGPPETTGGAVGVAVTPDGSFVYVTNSFDGTVSAINAVTLDETIIDVGLSSSSFPSGVAITPDGASAYIVNTNDPSISVIDISTNTVTATILSPLLDVPANIAITPDGRFAYVTNSQFGSTTVSIIDIATNTINDNAEAGLEPLGITIGTVCPEG